MYDGTHSITFRTINGQSQVNTWTDWFLIPTSRPSISIPTYSNKYVEIPGMNGSYDLTNYLVSSNVYSDRSGNFEFVVDNDHISWIDVARRITLFINGQKLRMIFSDDPNYYYEGRFTFDSFQSDQANSKVVINYRVSPIRHSV